MSQYILSIDQGTTSSRAILFDKQGKSVNISQQEFPQYFPNEAWVEHKPDEIWQSVKSTCLDVIKKHNITGKDIAAVGITNQRETTVIWDRHTGKPIYNAIVWQDRRTSDYCQSLQEQGLEPKITEKTGLLLDPYFSASKIKWLLDHVDGARALATEGRLAFGTIDCYLLWQLTGGKSHKTDATNASRTMLFNIHQQCWDEELLSLFDIPLALLPEVCDSASDFGLSEHNIFGEPIPVLGIAGDQQAALIGQACFQPGMAKSTYGTGCFFMLNTGNTAHQSTNRLLTTVAYRLNGTTAYALEGSIFMAGATIQWLRDGLKLFKSAADTQAIVAQIEAEHGVVLVPAFTGLGAPYWDPDARGAILGLTRDSGIKEIVAAALQSVAYQTKDLQKAMEKDGMRPSHIRVDGGMVGNDWVMQFLADMLGAHVDRPKVTETTALGVAYLAGLKLGWYQSLTELEEKWQLDNRFEATYSKAKRDRLYEHWLQAIEKVKTN